MGIHLSARWHLALCMGLLLRFCALVVPRHFHFTIMPLTIDWARHANPKLHELTGKVGIMSIMHVCSKTFFIVYGSGLFFFFFFTSAEVKKPMQLQYTSLHQPGLLKWLTKEDIFSLLTWLFFSKHLYYPRENNSGASLLISTLWHSTFVSSENAWLDWQQGAPIDCLQGQCGVYIHTDWMGSISDLS